MPKARRKTPAQKTWTHQALQAFTNASLAEGSTPTAAMIARGFVKENKTPNPAAAPFLTGEQLLSQSDSQLRRDEQVQELVNQLAQAKYQAAASRQNVERGRVRGVAGTQDDAAARGIFQSSIKDGQIFDINAQAATQQQQINDQLQALQTASTSRISLLDEALRRASEAFDQMRVENASQIDTGFTTSYTSAAPTVTAPRRPTPAAAPHAIGGRRQPTTGSRRRARRH